MRVRNATEQQVYDAAKAVGVRVSSGGRGGVTRRLCRRSTSGVELTFTLKTGCKSKQVMDWRGKLARRAPYTRLSTRLRQSADKRYEGVVFAPAIPSAVCWHGHRDYLRALFQLVPDAEVKTAMATYRGRADFEAKYQETGESSHPFRGYQLTPYRDACICDESDGEDGEGSRAEAELEAAS